MKKLILLIFTQFFLFGCVSSPMQGALVTLDTSHHVYGYSNGPFINSSKIVKYGRSCSY
ncbi:MAG: hypothetical protein IT569_03090, partial [Leptospiraceae bacterium]|nr:hypothetical protein [Leptospiraceae bacterium]